MKAAIETINDVHTDERLRHLKAIVFLSLKPKKRGENYNRLSQDEFGEVVKHAMDKKVPFGFDSCSSNKFIAAVKDDPKFNRMITSVEPCEATCFSFYVDVKGEYFPCSFTPGLLGWDNGVDVVNAEDFVEDVWNAEKTKGFRKQLNENKCGNGCRSCILYDI
jgi:radical SAM protein with 4Fe4S-binding SPASM domain